MSKEVGHNFVTHHSHGLNDMTRLCSGHEFVGDRQSVKYFVGLNWKK